MKYIIPISAILLFFSSCVDNSRSELAVFETTAEGFENANRTISLTNQILYKSFKNEISNPRNYSKIEVWKPKVERIKILCSELTEYIQGLRSDLKTEVEDNLDATDKLFVVKGKGKELSEKLFKFKKEILNIDSGLNKVFGKKLIIVSESFDSTDNANNDFAKTFFNRIPAIAAISMLNKFENSVLTIENDFLKFCNSKLINYDDFYNVFQVIVGQSSSYVKAGEQIEITAGVGAFTISNKPKITINGKVVPLTDEAVAIYKFKTPRKAGKYSVPVKFEYTREDGTNETTTKDIEYTVIEKQ